MAGVDDFTEKGESCIDVTFSRVASDEDWPSMISGQI